MQNEFDFVQLRQHWQQQNVTQESAPNKADLATAQQRQRQQWRLLLGEWLGAMVMGGTAIWLITAMPSWLSTIAATVLFIGVVMSAIVSWHIHRPLITYANWSSQGVLAFRLRSCQLSLWYYRYNQLGCLLLLGFVGVLWGLWAWQPTEVPSSLLQFYSLIAAPLCLYGMVLLQRKIATSQKQLLDLKRLIAEFEHVES